MNPKSISSSSDSNRWTGEAAMQGEGVLFWTYDWHAVVDAQREALRNKVYGLDATAFEGRTVDQVADALADEFALVPPDIVPRQIQIDQRKGSVDVSGDPNRFFAPGRPAAVQGLVYDVRLPFTGDPQMFGVRPIAYDDRPPQGKVGDGVIEFSVGGVDMTPEAAAKETYARVRHIADYLRRQRESMGTYPEDLRRLAGDLVGRRKMELTEEDDLWAGLDFIKKPPQSAAG